MRTTPLQRVDLVCNDGAVVATGGHEIAIGGHDYRHDLILVVLVGLVALLVGNAPQSQLLVLSPSSDCVTVAGHTERVDLRSRDMMHICV